MSKKLKWTNSSDGRKSYGSSTKYGLVRTERVQTHTNGRTVERHYKAFGQGKKV